MTIVYHERFLDHMQDGPWHPERPGRLAAVVERLRAEGLWDDVLEPSPADLDDCLRIHDATYLDRLRHFGEGPWDPDTYVRPETFEIALLAAGGAILTGKTAYEQGKPVFGLLRPPGHHAIRDQAMGFCYLNNIAIAAASLLADDARRVAIIDIDLHHGNGTQEAFYASDRTLYISLHQWPHFPGSGWFDEIGEGVGEGRTINVPLPPGSGDATYADAFDRVVEPAIRDFKPEMILVSFGGDAHYADPLGSMALSSQGILDQFKRLGRLATELCGGRLAFFLEGGYDVDVLAEVVAFGVAHFSGKQTELHFTENSDPNGCGRPRVDQVVESIGKSR